MNHDLDKIRPLMSEYILSGYKQDELVLEDVNIDENEITGYITVNKFRMPSDGVYHFTAFHTELWVSQLLIIYAHHINNHVKHTNEAYMVEHKIRMKKKVQKTQRVKIQLSIVKKRNFKQKSYISADFNVEDDSFVGSMSAVIA